jgi:hypothetical protein
MSYPATVKGVGIKQNGGVEVIENLELPFPEVYPGDMLVKVMNHLYLQGVSPQKNCTPLRFRYNLQESTFTTLT